MTVYENAATPDPLGSITPPQGRFYRIAVLSRTRVRAFYGDFAKHTSLLVQRVRGRWLVTRE
ncbi:MAG: hypothetical protein QOH88_1437 [Verrucomicrobiota bacterium]|jgi:hypothetical protein